MMHALDAARLELLALNRDQLEMLRYDPSSLEHELRIPLARTLLDLNVDRALRLKLGKMLNADPAVHNWFTYWLVVLKQERVGVGLLGFKGCPDQAGSTEIGYGIAPEYQGMGYMSEAVACLLAWAFSHSYCRRITATNVINPASARLLEKLGFQRIGENQGSTSWELLWPAASVHRIGPITPPAV